QPRPPCFDRLSMRIGFSWHLPKKQPHPEPPHAELVEARRMRRPRQRPEQLRRPAGPPGGQQRSALAIDRILRRGRHAGDLANRLVVDDLAGPPLIEISPGRIGSDHQQIRARRAAAMAGAAGTRSLSRRPTSPVRASGSTLPEAGATPAAVDEATMRGAQAGFPWFQPPGIHGRPPSATITRFSAKLVATSRPARSKTTPRR